MTSALAPLRVRIRPIRVEQTLLGEGIKKCLPIRDSFAEWALAAGASLRAPFSSFLYSDLNKKTLRPYIKTSLNQINGGNAILKYCAKIVICYKCILVSRNIFRIMS